MSDNLQDRGRWNQGLIDLSFFALKLSDKTDPITQAEFDYPFFVARELTGGLQANGELDFY